MFPILVSAITYRRRAKAPKNTAKNTSKAPKEVDLTIEPTLPIPTPSTIIEQPKDYRTFILNIFIYADTIRIYYNVLAVLFGAFKY